MARRIAKKSVEEVQRVLEDHEPGIIKRDIGMPWKTALPGLGILGIVGGISAAYFLRERRQAMKMITGRAQ